VFFSEHSVLQQVIVELCWSRAEFHFSS